MGSAAPTHRGRAWAPLSAAVGPLSADSLSLTLSDATPVELCPALLHHPVTAYTAASAQQPRGKRRREAGTVVTCPRPSQRAKPDDGGAAVAALWALVAAAAAESCRAGSEGTRPLQQEPSNNICQANGSKLAGALAVQPSAPLLAAAYGISAAPEVEPAAAESAAASSMNFALYKAITLSRVTAMLSMLPPEEVRDLQAARSFLAQF